MCLVNCYANIFLFLQKKAIIEGENDDLSEVEELPEQSFRFSSGWCQYIFTCVTIS